MTAWPRQATLTRSVKSLATLKLTSADISAERTSGQGRGDVLLGEFESPRRSRRALVSLSVRLANTGRGAEGVGSKGGRKAPIEDRVEIDPFGRKKPRHRG
jgi:hypothetical protein